MDSIGAANGLTVDQTEDASEFTAANLAQYKAVVWLSTTGDVLNDAQQAAFEGYIRSGGGYVGVHAAADTEYDWPWYGQLVGAWFKSHPATQQATVNVTDRAHPSTKDVPATWTRTDEWYDYKRSPRADVHVLAELQEEDVQRRDDGLRPPDRVVPGVRRRPHLLHGPRAHAGELRRAGVPLAPDRRDPVGGGAGVRRLQRHAAAAAVRGGRRRVRRRAGLQVDDRAPEHGRVRASTAARCGSRPRTATCGAAAAAAKNLILQQAPSGAWEITTKVTINSTGGSQQAALLVYADDDNYFKLGQIARDGGRWFEVVQEIGGSPRHDAALDRLVIDGSYPTTFYLRLSQTEGTVTASASQDGATWSQVGRTGNAGAVRDAADRRQRGHQRQRVRDHRGVRLRSTSASSPAADTTPPTVTATPDGLRTSDGKFLNSRDRHAGRERPRLRASTRSSTRSATARSSPTPRRSRPAARSATARPTRRATRPPIGTHHGHDRDAAGLPAGRGRARLQAPLRRDGADRSPTGRSPARAASTPTPTSACSNSWGGMGLLWYGKQQLQSPYTIRAEWRMYADDDNSGVFIGFPDPGDDPWKPVAEGYEIQIDPTDSDPTRRTGSVYSFQAANAAALALALEAARPVERDGGAGRRPADRDPPQRGRDQPLHVAAPGA